MHFTDKFRSVQMMPSWPRGQTNVHRHHLELQPSVAACLPWLGTGTSWITILKHLLGVAIYAYLSFTEHVAIFFVGASNSRRHYSQLHWILPATTHYWRRQSKGPWRFWASSAGRFFSDTFRFYLHNHGRKYANQLELPEVGASL